VADPAAAAGPLAAATGGRVGAEAPPGLRRRSGPAGAVRARVRVFGSVVIWKMGAGEGQVMWGGRRRSDRE